MPKRSFKSKSCVEGRLLTVNTRHNPSCWSNQCSQIGFVCEELHTEKGS